MEKLVGEDGLTVLINNAGIFVPYDIDGEKSRSTLIRQLETNTISTVLITQELLPLLKRAAAKNRGEGYSINRSAIINISSTAGSITKIDASYNIPLVIS